MTRSLPAALSIVLLACSSDPVAPDAEVARDAGADAPAEDAAAPIDAGPAPERPTLTHACDDALAEVYASTAGTVADPLAVRGEIVACSYQGWLSIPVLASRMAASGIAPPVTPITGAHRFVVAFRTTRRGGAAGVSSANVFVPDTLARTPSPMLVFAHGTTGIADRCAASSLDAAGDYVNLPFASSGWPVIAPDYAGLGTEGVQGYGDNDDTGRSTLDAARALRALLPAGTLTDEIVMTGHSQGGGSVLSAQAMAGTYGAGGELALVIPFAPGWAIGSDVTGFRFPGVSTTFGGGQPAAIASIFLYAWGAGTLGAARAGEVFAPSSRDAVVTALERDCVFALAASIPAAAPTYGDLVEPSLRSGVVSCADGGACTGLGQQLWDFLGANVLTPDAAGAPVIVLAGTSDTLATPADVACIVDHLESAGVTPTVCVDGSTHYDVVQHGVAFAIAAASARIDGRAMPACPGTASLPACR